MISGYPRPQLVRAGHTCLDGEWGFATDPAEVGIAEGWYNTAEPFDQTIRVPFPPESPASGIGENVTRVIWYRRQFSLQPTPGQRQLLHFEGVDHHAMAWLNGTYLGEHEGSQSGFSFDITTAARDGVNTLVVRATDDARDLEQPRGKQDWQPEPHVIWYRRTSGIWRTVWWEPVPNTRIDRVELVPQADLRSVAFTAHLVGLTGPRARVELTLRQGDRVLADVSFRCTSHRVRGTIVLDHEDLDTEPQALLWTPESPTLIDADIALTDHGQPVDTVASYFGLRTVGTDDGRILLNGQPRFLRLVLNQGYWPETHLATPSLEELDREARLIREFGFDGMRMHQVSADPRFLEACDRYGLLVLADTAAAYSFTDTALKRTMAELSGLIARDLNHPSVIGWVPFNESWGLPGLQTSSPQQHAVQTLFHLIKALDPSRLALGNDGWHHVDGDIVGVHDYSQDATELRDRYRTADDVRRTLESVRPAGRPLLLAGHPSAAGAPVMLTEFGGISAHTDPSAWKAYGDVVSDGDLAAQIGQLVAAVGPQSGLAGYCYTQLSDTAQEKNGILTEQRQPKSPPSTIRAAIRGQHAGHPPAASVARYGPSDLRPAAPARLL